MAGGAGWVTARSPHYVLIFVYLAAQSGRCRITLRKSRWHLLLEDPRRCVYALSRDSPAL